MKNKNIKTQISGMVFLLTFLAMIGNFQFGSAATAAGLCEGTNIIWTGKNYVTDGSDVTYEILVTGIDNDEIIGDYTDESGNSYSGHVLSDKLVSMYLNSSYLGKSSIDILFMSDASSFNTLNDTLADLIAGTTVEMDGTSIIVTDEDNYYEGTITYDSNYVLVSILEETNDESAYSWVRTTALPGRSCVESYTGDGSGDSGASSSASGDSDISGMSSGGSAIGPEIFQNPAILAYMVILLVGFMVIKKRNQRKTQ